MPSQYLDTTLLEESFDTFLNLLATDKDKENALFEYPIDVLEVLLQLFEADERYEICQLIKNVLAIKNDPPVGTVLNYGELQVIYDNAVHTEFKNQLKAVLISVKITSEMHGISLDNFSFLKLDTGSIHVKEIKD